jgi:hypothetical protein
MATLPAARAHDQDIERRVLPDACHPAPSSIFTGYFIGRAEGNRNILMCAPKITLDVVLQAAEGEDVTPYTRGTCRICYDRFVPSKSMATATISFGLVTVPVRLYSAAESTAAISFNLLHAKDHSRLRQQSQRLFAASAGIPPNCFAPDQQRIILFAKEFQVLLHERVGARQVAAEPASIGRFHQGDALEEIGVAR